jgi:hypothetical protein
VRHRIQHRNRTTAPKPGRPQNRKPVVGATRTARLATATPVLTALLVLVVGLGLAVRGLTGL